MDKNQNYVDYIGIILMTSTLHIKFGGGEGRDININHYLQSLPKRSNRFTFPHFGTLKNHKIESNILSSLAHSLAQ